VPNPETRLSSNRLGLLVKKGGQPSRLAQIGGVASLYYAKIHRPSYYAKINRPSLRRGKPSAPKRYVPNRVPEPCHQERAEARPVRNANRLGDHGMAFVMTL
jgi:hypothetical protein